MPRKITIFLSAPPGDGLRAAREHFHDYVKPILVAGALDWDVIEGRREGDVRAGLAEKIRKLRRKRREKAEAEEPPEEDVVGQLRQHTGTREWDGVPGDLILGRHTWKEYIRGLHEGWLGPLDPPRPPEELPIDPPPAPDTPTISLSRETPSSDPSSTAESFSAQADPSSPPPKPPVENKKPSTPTPPYISTNLYPTFPLPLSLPEQLPPTLTLPFPHLLGFLNTPTRLYRFLTRRRLADETGRQVAALVLASSSRPFDCETDFVTAADPDSPTITDLHGAVVQGKRRWEQEDVLKGEEAEWHKSAWAENQDGEERERPWREKMVLDGRIAERMRQFELAPQEAVDNTTRELNMRVIDGSPANQEIDKSWTEEVKSWFGMEKKEMSGWEMGLVGDPDD